MATSETEDIERYFDAFDTHIKSFDINTENLDLIDRSFNKKRAADRKEWLQTYDVNEIMEYSPQVKKIKLEDFIEKDLKHFSNSDNLRSIPKLMDGFKPSQRKVIYTLLKHYPNQKKEKVAILASGIAAKSNYHHGTNSLEGVITNLSQTFVGSNNVPLITGYGGFGTRSMGGADCGAPRYIKAALADVTKLIFPSVDFDLPPKNREDGQLVEPEFLLPIIPMCLVGQTIGIGTGYSTFIPSFNIREIIEEVRKRISGSDCTASELLPYYNGFKGHITPDYEIELDDHVSVDGKIVTVTELPPNMSIITFKEHMEKLISTGKVLKYKDDSTKDDPSFVIDMDKEYTREEVLIMFNLKKSISISNMTMFDADGNLKKYESPAVIIDEFYNDRQGWYEKRKLKLERDLEEKIIFLGIKIEFIKAVLSKEVDLMQLSDQEIQVEFETRGWNIYSDKLLGLPIKSMTKERIISLEKESETAKNEMIDLKDTSIQDMWMDDLQKLEDYLK